MRNEQNNTRHTVVRKSSLRCSKPNTALQSSLRQSSNHCKTPNHTFPAQGAAPRRTQSLDPNRRPYTTERLRCTQNNTATQSFQLVFRVQSHDARRCVNSNSNRKTAMKFTNLKTQTASHTGRIHTNCSSSPQLTFETTSRQVPVRSPVRSSRLLAAIPLPFSMLTLYCLPTNQCRSPLLRALAPKPVVARVAGGPRSDRNAVREVCLRGPLPVCAPCCVPNAAPGGVVTRRSLQGMFAGPRTRPSGDAWRSAPGCVHALTQRGHSTSGRCYPRLQSQVHW